VITRWRTLLIALIVGGASTVGLAASASAAGVTEASASCSGVLTVVPTDIVWAPGHVGPWWEDGTVTEVGSCVPGATSPVVATGTWQRVGGPKSSVTGECPRSSFSLQDTRTGAWTNYFEMTSESPTESSQVIGINPIYTPGIPVGTESFTTQIPTGGVRIAHTDPVACSAWPTTDAVTEPFSVPGPPTFHIVLEQPALASLLHACVTIRGIVPRTCLQV
jgi:hypothetical protein